MKKKGVLFRKGQTKSFIRQKNDEGNFSGRVVHMYSNVPLQGVQVLIMAKGQISRATSGPDGSFYIEVESTKIGDGFNVHFKKEGFQNATRAAIVELPNYHVSLNDVKLRPILNNQND